MGCQYIWHGYGPNTTIFLYIWPHRPVWGYIVFIISNGADRPYFRFSHSTPPILGRSYITEYDRQYDIDHHLTPHFGHYRGSHHSLFRILRGAGFLMGSDTIWVTGGQWLASSVPPCSPRSGLIVRSIYSENLTLINTDSMSQFQHRSYVRYMQTASKQLPLSRAR